MATISYAPGPAPSSGFGAFLLPLPHIDHISQHPFLARSLLAHSEMPITCSGPPCGPRPCRAICSGGPASVGPSTDSAPGTGSARAAGGH